SDLLVRVLAGVVGAVHLHADAEAELLEAEPLAVELAVPPVEVGADEPGARAAVLAGLVALEREAVAVVPLVRLVRMDDDEDPSTWQEVTGAEGFGRLVLELDPD